jgi:hypothetical protein
VAVAGWGLLSGRTWARVVGITLAVLSAIANFLWLPYYQFWALIVLTMDVFVIWAIAAHLAPARHSPQVGARASTCRGTPSSSLNRACNWAMSCRWERNDRLEGVVGGRLVGGTLRRRRQELLDGGGEPAGVGDRKAVPEAGQLRAQLGQAAGRAQVLLVVR